MTMSEPPQRVLTDRRAKPPAFAAPSGRGTQPAAAAAVRSEDPRGGSPGDLGYGCVDWYRYPPGVGRPECPSAAPRRNEPDPAAGRQVAGATVR
jgi:hypothetical protein